MDKQIIILFNNKMDLILLILKSDKKEIIQRILMNLTEF